jgi:hypothetical protein
VSQPRRLAAALTVCLTLAFSTWAEDLSDDPLRACGSAAALAETDWHLPAGLLSAIGIVESGRSGLGSTLPVAWPWSINADGRGFYLSSKAAAIATVRALQAAGWRAIDVGCFQVDLLYHPGAFATVEAAFDPNANAQAAARILARARFGGTSWDTAIAVYHSASPIRGAVYLQQVRAVWPGARTRSIATDTAYAVLLSPAARQVRVITADDALTQQAVGLPRVLGPQMGTAVLQWTATPLRSLPAILMPTAGASSRSCDSDPPFAFSRDPSLATAWSLSTSCIGGTRPSSAAPRALR